MSFRQQMRYMNAYDIHKAIINEYVLRKPGDTQLLRRDSSKDTTDLDVLKQSHRFLWGESVPDTWEAQFAKKYYDKLYKEYALADLSCYKENKVALRWRTEQEVVVGKGQFICGNKRCSCEESLKSWEVNFAYQEQNERKNALVKLRLCVDCSSKLNYHTKKREVKRLQHKHHDKRKVKKKTSSDEGTSNQIDSVTADTNEEMSHSETEKVSEESPWANQTSVEMKSRDEEMEEYLEDLLL